jgi:hypothetical protein
VTDDEHDEAEWSPSTDHLRSVLGLTSALARGDSRAIRLLTREMTLYQGAMSCFVLSQVLLKRLAELMGMPLENLVALLSHELDLGGDTG